MPEQQPDDAPSTSGNPPSIALNSAQYAYPGCAPFIRDCTLNLPRGSRCLLIGANGAGKTTLLQIVAGKYMVPQDAVRVLGRPPFHDMVRRRVAVARRAPDTPGDCTTEPRTIRTYAEHTGSADVLCAQTWIISMGNGKRGACFATL